MTPTIEYPFILVNLKTYEESLGPKAVALATIARLVSQETGVCIAVAPQTVDLTTVINAVKSPSSPSTLTPWDTAASQATSYRRP